MRDGSVVHRNPKVTPPVVPGWDLAGEVAAVGDGVTGLDARPARRRDAVLADLHRRRRRVLRARRARRRDWSSRRPTGSTIPTAATIPLNALTADQALAIIDPAPGTTLLVTGASGAVGAFGAQFGVQRGLRVIAQAGRDDEDFVWSLGVEEVLPRDADLTAIDEVDNVLDAVPLGPVAATRMAAAAPRCSPAASKVRRRRDSASRSCCASTIPSRCAASSPTSGTACSTTRVAQVLPLEDAPRAHELTETGGNHGKIVLAFS